MPKGQAKPHPAVTVKAAAALAQAIRDTNAGRPTNRLLLADAMGKKPASPEFRELITASGRYGFTKGSYQAETLSLTPRGERLTTPRSEDERLAALREGMRAVPIFEQLLQHFNGNKLPEEQFLTNTLRREPFSVAAGEAEECARVFAASGKDVGFIRPISGSWRVLLDAGPPAEPEAEEGTAEAEEVDEEVSARAPIAALEKKPLPIEQPPPVESAPSAKTAPLQLFVAHGKKKGPADQLGKILTEFGIPFVVAEHEPHAGRPISQKVKELMDSCTAGIFIFTADEKFTDADGDQSGGPEKTSSSSWAPAPTSSGQRSSSSKRKRCGSQATSRASATSNSKRGTSRRRPSSSSANWSRSKP